MELGDRLKHTGYGSINWWRGECKVQPQHLSGHDDASYWAGVFAAQLLRAGRLWHKGCRDVVYEAHGINFELAVHMAVRRWIEDPEHQWVILDPHASHMGVGTATAGSRIVIVAETW